MKNLKSPLGLLILVSLFSLLTIFSCKKDEEEIKLEEPLTTCLAKIDSTFQEVILDTPPEYLDGGDVGFLKNLFSTINYPADARENGIQGTALLNYEITEEGTVENVEILDNPGGGIGEELKLSFEEITSGISYSPGILNSSPIRVKKKISATFKLQG